MFLPVQVTAPTSTPVSLTEAKAHLRVEDSNEDVLITALIEAATAHLDGWSGTLVRCLVEQTWRQDYADFSQAMRLPLAPVASITSVKYQDADDNEQTVASSSYELFADSRGPYVRFVDSFSAPTVHGEGASVSITYVAGYSAVPYPIRSAVLLLVGHWYEHRESVVVGLVSTVLPMAVQTLVAPFRRARF